MNLREQLLGNYYAKDNKSYAMFDKRFKAFRSEMVRRLAASGLAEQMAEYLAGLVIDSVADGKVSYKYTGIKKWTVKGDVPSAYARELGYAYDILNELMRQLGHDIVPADEKSQTNKQTGGGIQKWS